MSTSKTPRQTPGQMLAQVTSAITRPTLEALDALARRKDRPRAYLIRLAIEQYVHAESGAIEASSEAGSQ